MSIFKQLRTKPIENNNNDMSHLEILKVLIVSFLLVCIIHQTTALVYTDKDGVTVKYKVTMGNSCGNEGESFNKFVGIPIAECVKECGIRQYCKGLRYHRRFTLCELLSDDDHGLHTDRSCIFIPTSDIVVEQNHCPSCGDEIENPTVETEKSEIKECKDIDKDSWLRGNMRNVGNKIMQRCDNDYKGYNYSVCLEDGTWSTGDVCKPLRNVALGKKASMSSNHSTEDSAGLENSAGLGVDGNFSSFFHTGNQFSPWWLVDLGSLFNIVEVKVFNRFKSNDPSVLKRAKNFSLQLGMTMDSLREYENMTELEWNKTFELPPNTFARYVKTQINTTNYFHLTEVQVMAYPP